MQQWEYDAEVLHADTSIEGARAYLARRWPDRKFPPHAVESLIPALNRRGADGWQLVSLEPVIAGDKGDVKLPVGDPGQYWTTTYLAIWQRELSDKSW